MDESFQHKLEKFDVGNRVAALNKFAAGVLDVKPDEVFGNEIVQVHPHRSRA